MKDMTPYQRALTWVYIAVTIIGFVVVLFDAFVWRP